MSDIKRSDERNFLVSLRKRFSGVRGGHLNPSFRKKASLVLVSVVMVVYGVSGFVFWLKVVDDQTPYLFEIQLKKSLGLEARLRTFLRSREGMELKKIATIDVLPEAMFLPRWPVGDEIFVGSSSEDMVIGRFDAQTLWMRPMEELNSFWKSEDGFAYVITTGGINLGSSRPDLMSAKTGMKRKEIDEFFRSGIAAGTRIFKDPEKGDRIVSHREVAGTNVILFSEAPLAELGAEQARFFKWALVALGGAALLTIGVGIYLVNVLVRPFKLVLYEARDLALDRLTQTPRFEFQDDLHALHRVILLTKARIQNAIEIQAKEQALRGICHAFFKSACSAQNQRDVLVATAELFAKHPRSVVRKSSVTAYFLPTATANDSGLKLYKRALSRTGAPDVEERGSWSNEFEHNAQSLASILEKGEVADGTLHDLICPVSLGSIPLGFLLVSGANIGRLSLADRRWLGLVGRILGQALWQLPPE